MARERWPGLVSNEIFKDGGEDGFQVSGALDGSRVLALACSLSVGWGKIEADLKRILGRKPEITELWFFTPAVVTAVKADKWRARLRTQYGVALTVFSREEIVQNLLRPAFGYLIDHHLRLPPARSRGYRLTDNPQARIDAFLDEYLVSETGPVPFGGRRSELAWLDSWLLSHDEPSRCLITAPAGRGKSALVVRWIESMRQRGMIASEGQVHAEGWRLVFVPISMRFGTNEPRKYYRALAERLARVTGEPLETPLTDHAEYYAGKVRESLASLARTTQRALVVIDGVDEALGGEFDSTIIPRALPATLRVVVTARWLSGDHDSKGWLGRLDWVMHVRATSFDLPPLSETDITEVLTEMGAPLDVVADDPALVQRLAELSMGEPLIIHYYVIDLWHRGDELARIRREDLDGMKPGFGAYFERWLALERKAWHAGDAKIDGASDFDRLVDGTLMLFAFAHGPLERHDVVRLLPALIGRVEALSLSTALQPLRRFIIGNGSLEFGYILSHPMIGGYLQRDRFFGMGQTVERAFVDWGKAVIQAVNSSHTADAHVPRYLLRFYRSHLRAVGADVASYMELVQDGWRRAWQSYDGPHGFASDVRAALVASRESHAAGRLGDQLRCVLTLSSIRSLSYQTPPSLIVAAVKHGVITLRQARHLIEAQTPRQKVESLVGLVSEGELHVNHRIELLQEAIGTGCSIGEPSHKVLALSGIVPHVEGSQREEVLRHAVSAVRQVARSEQRIMSVCLVASFLSRQQCIDALHDALTDAGAIGSEFFASKDFNDVLARLGPDEFAVMLSTATTMDSSHSEPVTNAIRGLAPHLNGDQLATALSLVEKIPDQHLRGQALSGLAGYLKAGQLDGALAVAETMTDGANAYALGSLAAWLDARQMSRAAVAASAIASGISRAIAFARMAPYLNSRQRDDFLPKAYEAAKSYDWETLRARTLVELALQMRGEWIDDVFTHVEALEDARAKADALADLAIHLVGKQSARARDGALSAVKQNPERGQWALIRLAPYLGDAQLAEAVGAAKNLVRPEDRARILSELLPHLGGALHREALCEALAAAARIGITEHRVHALAQLAHGLGNEQLSEALVLARVIGDARERVAALSQLVDHVEGQLREEIIFEATRCSAQIDASFRMGAHLGMVSHLRGDHRAAVLDEALELTRISGEDRYKAYGLVELSPYLDPGQLEEAVGVAETIENQAERAETLVHLAGKLSDERCRQVLDEALRVARQVHPFRRASVLTQIAVSFPDSYFQETLPDILDAIKTTPPGKMPVRALLSLMPHMNAAQCAETVDEARRIARALDGDLRASLLLQIANVAGAERRPELIAEAFAAVLRIRNVGSRSRALREVAHCLDENQLNIAIDAVQAEFASASKASTLAALGALLKGERRHVVMMEAVETTKLMRLPRDVESLRGYTLAGVVRQFGADASPCVLAISQAISDSQGRAAVFSALLPYLAGVKQSEVLCLAIGAAKEIHDPEARAQALLELEAHCRGLQLGEIRDCRLAAAVSIDDSRRRARALVEIVNGTADQRSEYALRELIAGGESLPRPEFLRIIGMILPALVSLGEPEVLGKLYAAIRDTAAWYP